MTPQRPSVRSPVLSATPPSNGRPGGESGGRLPATGATAPGGAGPGGAAAPPAASDGRAPRILVRPRRARASARGAVVLRATCPSDEINCRVHLRLRLGSDYVATRTLSVVGGATRTFRLQLRRSARRRLARKGSLRVIAVIAGRDAAGNQATARTAIRLLAPRRRS